jgi:signal transduction histidine kinase
MNVLIQELLLLARMDSADAALQLNIEPVNLSECAADTIADECARIAQKGLQVSADIAPDIVVDSDYNKLRQLIDILLDNAIKYTDAGGRIEMSLAKSGKYARYSISNSGTGIASDELPMIFERFFRARQAESTEGNGLGLCVAMAIAQRLGGDIIAESTPGEMTTFTVTVPL